MSTEFQVGDKVAYSVQFLKSIGMSHSEMAHARGVITQLNDLSKINSCVVATIQWDRDAGLPERIHIANLAKVGLNTKFSNC